MTKAFAAVARKGIAVTPYGILKVTTADGETLYEHEDDSSRVLSAPWVAAGMTDLMQTAVNTGTGRNAQIGRPVAGKTGTTTSNKDGWFIGFSSWPLPPASGWAATISKVVGGLARRPFASACLCRLYENRGRPASGRELRYRCYAPWWQLEPDDEAYGLENGSSGVGQMVDPDGILSSGPTGPGMMARRPPVRARRRSASMQSGSTMCSDVAPSPSLPRRRPPRPHGPLLDRQPPGN